MTNSKRDRIRQFVISKLRDSGADLSDGDALFSTGRIDSLAAVELILMLEQGFGLDAGHPDFDPAMLDSIDEIMLLIN
ncbi:acyl carrier protein [Mesorhizobium sp. PAMC28654]|uniref:acyl carrier protein n=1 Tax=Mesorhizobium sp. PAMC28654 TaxID=2880934 RepID=UPI001D0A6638|nr:acyl carrier protein [Mesorhizobium sp. PAMC28654]UDL91931.1 acyl carrier protein [Mesorhizobium sp. PAMC28654]